MTESRYPTSKQAKAAGWHSRRHETNHAQTEARENYQRNRGRKARQRRAMERAS
jgi:hypothetical protein